MLPNQFNTSLNCWDSRSKQKGTPQDLPVVGFVPQMKSAAL